eukprot:8733051-Lingulodinium_polyedra.AAC.1
MAQGPPVFQPATLHTHVQLCTTRSPATYSVQSDPPARPSFLDEGGGLRQRGAQQMLQRGPSCFATAKSYVLSAGHRAVVR